MLVIDETNIDVHSGGFIGGFYIRPMGPHRASDKPAEGHKHYIDHVMNLVRGKVLVEWDDAQGVRKAVRCMVPCKLLIKSEISHWITPLEDDTFWECWFSEAQAEAQLGTVDVPWHGGKSDG
jgi:hypothetical protein